MPKRQRTAAAAEGARPKPQVELKFLTVQLPVLFPVSEAELQSYDFERRARLKQDWGVYHKEVHPFYQVRSEELANLLRKLFESQCGSDPDFPGPRFAAVSESELSQTDRVLYAEAVAAVARDVRVADCRRSRRNYSRGIGDWLAGYHRRAVSWAQHIAEAEARDDAAVEDVAAPPAVQPAQAAKAPEAEADQHLEDEQDKRLPPSRVRAEAAYNYAMEKIAGADTMSICELHIALRARLEIEMAKAQGNQWEKLGEFLNSLPPNAETWGRYLRQAHIYRYDTKGDRLPGRSVRRRNEI